MASSSKSQNLDELFDSFMIQLKVHLDQITSEKSTGGKVIQNFDKDLHWQKLGLCFQSVSKECTKLAVGFSKHPIPCVEEAKLLIGSVKESVNVLWAWYEAFPISEGRTLSLELQKLVYRLLDAVQEFVLSIKAEGVSESSTRLQKTGRIWELCESYSSIAKDNRSASLKRLNGSYQLLDDALCEFEDEVKNADYDFARNGNEASDNWKETDKPLFQPCLGLIKAGKRMIKMMKNSIETKGNVESNEAIVQLDIIVELIDKLSPCVDDLVLSLYPPTDHQLVKENAKSLTDALMCCIQTVRSHHYTTEQDSPCIEFIAKALGHNLGKLSDFIIT